MKSIDQIDMLNLTSISKNEVIKVKYFTYVGADAQKEEDVPKGSPKRKIVIPKLK